MTEQLSDQSLENLAAPGGPTVSPQAAAALLARIDAVLDELYAMRQTVRQWADAESGASEDDSLRETALAFSVRSAKRVRIAGASPAPVSVDPIEAARLAAASLPEGSLTRQLAGAAGQGTWDEMYSNAEITHMQFGEPINAADLITQLSGSLGPAKPDELEHSNAFDIAWERFAE